MQRAVEGMTATAGAGGARDAGVVTPEAVRLDFDAADVGSRAIGFVVDWLIRFVVLVALSLAAGLVGSRGPAVPDWVVITLVSVLGFLLVWGYPIAFESLMSGRTPGKALMGLRVVTEEGAPIRFRHAAIRAALGVVDFGITVGFAAVVSAVTTARHQRLGDLVAGTIVLRERTGSRAPTAVRFSVPPGAESYAARIDPAGMTERDYAAVRTFLLRAGELDPPVRARLAWQLAQPLAERLAHTPPADVAPELFLVCAAARYQQRSRPGGQAVGASSPPAAPAAPTAPAGPAPGRVPGPAPRGSSASGGASAGGPASGRPSGAAPTSGGGQEGSDDGAPAGDEPPPAGSGGFAPPG